MRLLILALWLCLTLSMLSQAPALIPYQAVARDAGGEPLANANINTRFTIHDGSADGTSVWQEMQMVSTSALGLFTARLGSVMPLSNVDWANADKFMQVEIDLGSGFIDIGTQQMLSVPFALHSESAKSVQFRISDYGDTLSFGNGSFMIVEGLSASNPYGGLEGLPHTCGYPNVHNPHKTYGTMTDQDGNEYKTIIIGTQEWMAENLKTSKYRNGDSLLVETPFTWGSHAIDSIGSYWGSSIQGQYAPQITECPFGKLYNWWAVSDSRNLCPSGWHVPTYDDFQVLLSNEGALSPGNLLTANSNLGEFNYGTYGEPEFDNGVNGLGFSGLISPGSLLYTNYWSSSIIEPDVDPYGLSPGQYGVSLFPLQYALQNSEINFVRCVRD